MSYREDLAKAAEDDSDGAVFPTWPKSPRSQELEAISEQLIPKITRSGMPGDLLESSRARIEALVEDATPSARRALVTLNSLPWDPPKKRALSLTKVRNQLDKAHVGAEDLKKALVGIAAKIEFASRRTSAPDAPRILLWGPPGVGKTTIAAQFALALGRPLAVLRLGGVSDAYALRGMPYVYHEAQPGRIVQCMAGLPAKDPLVLLDEIEKTGSGHTHGNPQTVLLGLLDRAERGYFTDDFLGVPVDLRNVIWMASANEIDTISEPLLNRFRVLVVHPYDFETRVKILKKGVLPRMISETGLERSEVRLKPSGIETLALPNIGPIGVRVLEHRVGKLLEHIVYAIVAGAESVVVDDELVREVLGATPVAADVTDSRDRGYL